MPKREPGDAFATAFASIEAGEVRACALALVRADGTTDQYFSVGDAAMLLQGLLVVMHRDVLTLIPTPAEEGD